jgi:hypothetical protein
MRADDDETASKQELPNTLADSTQMPGRGGQDMTVPAADTSKNTEIRPHRMSTTHMLRWKAQAVEASNLDHPHIRGILQSSSGADYPAKTVRNLKFLQYVSNCIENDQIVHLSLPWSSHQPKYVGKLDSYYQNAITPLLNQITHGWTALYPYLKGYEEMGFAPNEIETDQHAVVDLLTTSSRCDRGNDLQAGGIYQFKKFRKFSNLIQYQILMSVSAKRTWNIFEGIYVEDGPSARLTCYRSIQEAIRRDPTGEKAESRVLSTPNALSDMLIALQKLSSERWYTLGRVLIGQDENAPMSEDDWSRYPVSWARSFEITAISQTVPPSVLLGTSQPTKFGSKTSKP